MKCANCGVPLPPDARACPNCGTLTPLYYSATGSSPADATVAASTYYPPPTPGQVPPTVYGADPYAAPPQNPYEPVAPPPPPLQRPYGSVPPPSPPPQREQRGRKGLIIGIGIALLVLVLITAGIFALIRPNTAGPTPTATTTASSPTVHPTSKPTVNSNATATAISSQNPYPPHTGTLVLDDPLRDNSRGYKWDEATYTGGDTCGFSGGAYHVTEKAGLICIPEASSLNLSNFAFEVDITITQGDNGGIAFRIDQVNKTFYYFDIGTNGGYVLVVYNGKKYITLSQGSNAVIKRGLNQANLLAVVANGNLITIYANGQIIDSVHDNTYTQGQIGVVAFTAANKGENDVIASNARVWKL